MITKLVGFPSRINQVVSVLLASEYLDNTGLVSFFSLQAVGTLEPRLLYGFLHPTSRYLSSTSSFVLNGSTSQMFIVGHTQMLVATLAGFT